MDCNVSVVCLSNAKVANLRRQSFGLEVRYTTAFHSLVYASPTQIQIVQSVTTDDN